MISMVQETSPSPPTAADIIQLVDRDLDLFEAINDGTESHLEGAEALPKVEPLTKAWDVAYVRFSVPDLDLYERWVEDFGLRVVHRDEETIYSRGISGDGFCHVAHRGPAKFLGFAMAMKEEKDLQILSENIDGCSEVHDIPGIEGEISGGKRVSFIDPVCNLLIEAVHGREIEALPPTRERVEYNYGDKRHYNRPVNKLQDTSGNREMDGRNTVHPGPPDVLKIGHVVLSIPVGPHHKMMSFMMETFGLLPSDSVYIEAPKSAEGHSINPQMFGALQKAGPSPLYEGTFAEGEATFACFFRCDRGEIPTDHHAFFILSLLDSRMAPDGQPINPQLSHASFEVANLDDVWRGHMQLKTKAEYLDERYEIAWGVGRHVLGSHIYDYWHDPYGHVHEHMSDGDRMTRSFGQRIHKISGMGPNGHNQWGPTVADSGIRNLDGPAAASFYQNFDYDTQQSLVNRDLSNVQELIDRIRDVS